jgi:hypothetical protein
VTEVSSDVKTTCCTSEKSIFRPPLGEIRVTKEKYSPVEDDFLTRFLNRVRKYQERGMFYILL